jgi:hypothetical protein
MCIFFSPLQWQDDYAAGIGLYLRRYTEFGTEVLRAVGLVAGDATSTKLEDATDFERLLTILSHILQNLGK